jgi:hypothetical protein
MIILFLIYMVHIFLSRSFNRSARRRCTRRDSDLISSYVITWFIPLMGIMWSFMDYLNADPDIRKSNSKFKRWFTNQDV